MEENDDDFFSDDGFDDLPPGTLYQLEQNAYRATQAPATQQQQQQQPLPELTVSTRPYVRSDHQTISGDNLKPSNATLQPPPRLHSGLTNDYDDWDIGELDAEVLDNGVAIQPDDALQQASVFATPAHHNEPHPHVEHGNIRAEAEDEYGYLPDPMEIEGGGGSSQYAELHRTHAELSEKVMLGRGDRRLHAYRTNR